MLLLQGSDGGDQEEDDPLVGPMPPELLEENDAMPEDARAAEVCCSCVGECADGSTCARLRVCVVIVALLTALPPLESSSHSLLLSTRQNSRLQF